jgi:hypothetical protein
MKKLPIIVSFIIGLILLSSILLISTRRLARIANAPTKSSIISQINPKEKIRAGYSFIWDEYDEAPGDQSGDDSVVFGSSFGPYHNYSELVTKLKNLNTTYPEIIELFSIGKTYFGRDIYCVRLTNESIMLPKTEMLIVSQHHAREQITVENALYFIDKVVDNWIKTTSTIEALLQTKAIYVIPSLNIDGSTVMSQFPWQRKTKRPIDEDNDGTKDEYEALDTNGDGYIDFIWEDLGNDNWNIIGFEGIDLDNDGKIGNDMPGGVDPNRNYDYQFGNLTGASDDPSSQGYHGLEAFSENCTAHFRDFAIQRNFITAVSLHSGVELFGGPWSYLGTHVIGRDWNLYLNMGNKLQNLTGLPFVTEFYPASGEWGDWMYGRPNGTLLEFTFETYGDFSTIYSVYNATTGYYHDRGVWDAFNPPADKVIDKCAQIYPGLLFIAEEAPYLSIQTVKQKVKENIHLKVTVTNPSSYIRTNGSIDLEFMTSQVIGLTPLNSTNTVNLGELGANSSKQVTFIFSIDQSNYSVHINIRAYGLKVGEARLEIDLGPSAATSFTHSTTTYTTTPAFGCLITIAGFLTFAVLSIIRRKKCVSF